MVLKVVSRQEEITQSGVGVQTAQAEKIDTASELNYISQPISSWRHCVLFIVNVKTKKKMEANHKKAQS